MSSNLIPSASSDAVLRRNARIDLLRGMSIILVLLHHFNIAYRLDDTALARVFGWPALQAVLRNGNYGVTMFFTISGFLITSHALKRFGSLHAVRPLAFYRRRATRILPCVLLLIVTVDVLAAFGIPIFGNQPETGGPVSMWVVNAAALTFWMNVLMAHSGWLNYVLCVMWSLAVEEIFYLGFPLLCIGLKRESLLLAAWTLFIVAGPIWRATHQDDESGFLFSYLACFDGIAIGCCTAVFARHVDRYRARAAPVQILVVMAMTVLYLAASIGQTNIYGVSLMALGTAVLIVTAPPARVFQPSVMQPILACGRLSLELYLFHLIVLGLLRTISPPDDVAGDFKLALLAVYLAGAIGLAVAIERFYARPLNRWGNGKKEGFFFEKKNQKTFAP